MHGCVSCAGAVRVYSEIRESDTVGAELRGDCMTIVERKAMLFKMEEKVTICFVLLSKWNLSGKKVCDRWVTVTDS